MRTLAFLILGLAVSLFPALSQTSNTDAGTAPAVPSASLPPQPSRQDDGADSSDQRIDQPTGAGGDITPRGDRNAGPALTNVPLIGAKRLLHSLSELDKPLSPAEITAYGAAVQSILPMSPALIRNLRQRIDASQKAAAMPPSGKRARPVSDSVRISLSARQTPLTLDATPNTVSVMSFYDRTGKAWPVASYVVGRGDAFQVYALQKGSNQIAVTPLVNHGYSNLVISLVEEDRPIVINLETSETRTDFRRDITVDGYGPNADLTPTTVDHRTSPSDRTMMAFAQGAALPRSAQRLSTSDPDVAAWSYKGRLYVRTTETLMSPSWSAALTGPGEVHAYRLKPTPIALVSRNGTIRRVRISR